MQDESLKKLETMKEKEALMADPTRWAELTPQVCPCGVYPVCTLLCVGWGISMGC